MTFIYIIKFLRFLVTFVLHRPNSAIVIENSGDMYSMSGMTSFKYARDNFSTLAVSLNARSVNLVERLTIAQIGLYPSIVLVT